MIHKTGFFSSLTLFLLLIGCQQHEVVSPIKPIQSPVTQSSVTQFPKVTNSTLDRTIADNTSQLSDGICLSTLQGTWVLSSVLDHDGNQTTCNMIYAHLPDNLRFTHSPIRLDWIDPTGFKMLDYTPNIPHECYHSMYKVNCDNRLLDIVDLYCSTPTPPAGRCGPPQYSRFKIVSLRSDEIILDSHSAGWAVDSYSPIPSDYIQRFIFQRVKN